MIHTLPDDPDDYVNLGNSSSMLPGAEQGFDFEDSFSQTGLGVTTTIHIRRVGPESEGVYACKNGLKSKDTTNEVK